MHVSRIHVWKYVSIERGPYIDRQMIYLRFLASPFVVPPCVGFEIKILSDFFVFSFWEFWENIV